MIASVFVLALATGQLSAVIRNVAAGSTQAQIQAIINSSASGDTISFASGTYNFTSALTLKSGLVVQGNGCTWNGNNASNIVKVVDAASLSNVTINNLTANNVMFRLWGSPGASAVNNVTFSNITFQNGRAESGLAQIDSRYLQFKATNVTVSACTFLRTSSFPGKCLHLYLAEGMSFTGNKVGTTSSTSPNPSTHGYFKTAINMNSDSVNGGLVNATISNNHIYRNTSMAIDSTNCDHGIYAHGFNSLTISNNTISGWPAAATGGAVKIRNGENATVSNNTFIRSGVLMYVYTTGYYLFLRNVDVIDNTITQDSWDGTPSIHKGIGFWRNYGDSTEEAEESIYISGNTITRGCINIATNTNTDFFNLNGGGVFNNTINTGTIATPAGIDQSGNVINP